MPFLSAVLIVRNEAAHLPRCLASLAGVVDEVVVADTGSHDDSPAIAAAHGARCVAVSWTDDFAAARNAAIAHATGDFALTIDADEYVENTEIARRLLAEFTETRPGHVGTVLIRNLVVMDGEAQEVIDHTERFFPRAHFRYEGRIHEQLASLGGEKRTASTGLRICHTGYSADPVQKALRNLPLLRRELAEHPEDEYYWYQTGKALFALRQFAEAAAAFDMGLRGIRFEPGAAPQGRLGAVGREVLTGLLANGAYAWVNAGQPAKARTVLEEHAALGHAGIRRADFPLALGYVRLIQGELAPARAAFEQALALGPDAEDVRGTGSHSAHYHLGLLCEASADLAGAWRHYGEALKTHSAHAPTLARCIDMVHEYGAAPPPEISAGCGLDRLLEMAGRRSEELERGGKARAAARLREWMRAPRPR